MLKDIIKKQPNESLPVSSVAKKQDHLGLTIPVLRFMRRYPTIFEEFVGPKYNVPWFRLTKEVSDLHNVEQGINQEQGMESVHRLCKMLMMIKSRTLPLNTLESWKWDLGLSDDYVETLIPNYPEYLSFVKISGSSLGVKLVGWKDELAISVLQKRAEDKAGDISYRNFKKSVPFAYEMNYPRGYGRMKKVISWMDEWQKLPYISPYEDVSNLDPESHLMEKRVVGVFHELLNLTIHKRTERNNFSPLREEMKLPARFTRIFTRYPGIFYLSRKCAKTTLTLREAYKSAQLLEKHPLVAVREKYFYMMRMGILYRKAGTDRVNANTARFDHGSSGTNEEVSDESHDQGLSDGRAPTDIHDFNRGTFVDNDYSEDDDKDF
ncbi:hypothetical protein SUGI_0646360 [Cryptomeria japonica]|nr:hypothetical protein SUGI_0646360 [Cryptomeria japonica]